MTKWRIVALNLLINSIFLILSLSFTSFFNTIWKKKNSQRLWFFQEKVLLCFVSLIELDRLLHSKCSDKFEVDSKSPCVILLKIIAYGTISHLLKILRQAPGKVYHRKFPLSQSREPFQTKLLQFFLKNLLKSLP